MPGKTPKTTTRSSRTRRSTEIAGIQAPLWVARVMQTTFAGNTAAELCLRFATTSTKARSALEGEVFDKRILFSNNAPDEASTAPTVTDYRSQEAVEADFRQMEDPSVGSFSAIFHFTEPKGQVHVFCCVLALTVARLVVRVKPTTQGCK